MRVAAGQWPIRETRTSATTRSTAHQQAGKSRAMRETVNCAGVRPQQLMQMTKPLMAKKNSTPSQP